MYRDLSQWRMVRRKILDDGVSRRQMVRETGISRKTIRKMLRYETPQPFGGEEAKFPVIGPYARLIRNIQRANLMLEEGSRFTIAEIYRYLVTEEGYRGSYGAVRGYLRKYSSTGLCHGLDSAIKAIYHVILSLERTAAIRLIKSIHVGEPLIFNNEHVREVFCKAIQAQSEATQRKSRRANHDADWINSVKHGDTSKSDLLREFPEMDALPKLLDSLYDRRKIYRNRALVVLAAAHGASIHCIAATLGVSRNTVRKSLKLFHSYGTDKLLSYSDRSNSKVKSRELGDLIFSVLHEPPRIYGFNRTSWTMALICEVLTQKGKPASSHVVRTITKAAGYKWRKARTVLTSNDQNYTEKLDRVKSVLANLQSNEAFFSIDEFGPFSVKAKAGLTLTPPGEQVIIQQWQRSKGCLILTAALELSSNHITHFYSEKKNTHEMIRMMDVLVERFKDRKTLYLSWDAASWHISKKLSERIEENNNAALASGGPIVKIVPLPARAQFLNVIESIFSGMARAIIHNSDYGSLEEAKMAIDRYFQERNKYFCAHPKRAGNKIWGKERVVPAFSMSNNCKDPRYR